MTRELEQLYEQTRQSEETRKQKIRLRRFLYDLLEPHFCESHAAALVPPLHSLIYMSLPPVVDLFLVGSSVNGLSSNNSDADMCLIFKDRPDLMDQAIVAAKLLEKIHHLISKEGQSAGL